MNRFEIYLIALYPTIGSEIKKTRSCVIISPDEMNRFLKTVIIALMTTAKKQYKSRINLIFQGKDSQIILDQIRTVDKQRLVKKIGKLDTVDSMSACNRLVEMFSY